MHLCLAEIKGDLTFLTPHDNLGEKNIGGEFEAQTFAFCMLIFMQAV